MFTWQSLQRVGTEGDSAEKTVVGTPGQDLVFTAVLGCGQPQGPRARESEFPALLSPRERRESQSPPDLACSCPGAQGSCSEKEPGPCALLSLPLREGAGERPQRACTPLRVPKELM